MIDPTPREPTVEWVRDSIKTLYAWDKHPRADAVQAILDRIEGIKDEKLRSVFFVEAKQNLLGDLKELVVASRARANRAWGDCGLPERIAKQNSNEETTMSRERQSHGEPQ